MSFMLLWYIFMAARTVSIQYRQTHSIGLLRQTAIEEINKIKEAGTWKSERVITSKQSSLLTVEGRQQETILNFCSNNYLGLAVRNVHTTKQRLHVHIFSNPS
jgi:hypothetical protein